MEESALDVMLAQEEDTSLTIDLCASLPSGAGHQNLGNPILGLRLAHLRKAADKYLGPFCAKGVRQQSLTVLEGSYRDS